MKWRLENENTIPALTNGNYVLMLGADELKELREAKNIGEIQRRLWDAAGRQRNPKKGHEALTQALEAGGSTTSALEEIRAALGVLS